MPYQVQYALHPAGPGKSLWIEDIGRWFADADGKPARAHGIVRVINERHDGKSASRICRGSTV